MNYKESYFAEFTKEVTTIELDYLTYGRWGEVDCDENMKTKQFIRASRYSSTKEDGAENYDVFINEIAQHTLNEFTLQPAEVLGRLVKRLVQMDEHIDDAWKILFEHWGLWNDGELSSFEFEWKFFHFFNMPVTRSVGAAENPHFEKGITSDSFFWDLQDAMMYKQGAVKWILWHLREQLGIEHPKEEEDPKSSDLPSVDRRIGKITQDKFALLYHYCLRADKKTDKDVLASKHGLPITAKLQQRINYYYYPQNRTGAEGDKTFDTRFSDFEAVIEILNNEGNLDAARIAETDFSSFKDKHENSLE